ncbi:MAG: phosphomannomutase/phosphoglucomutase [Cycloclasticus sp.]
MIATAGKAVLGILEKDDVVIKKIVLTLLLLVVVAGIAAYVHIGQAKQQEIEDIEQLNQRVNKTASLLSLQVKKWHEGLEVLAQDQALVAAFEVGDEAISEWLAEHHASIDDMTKLRVLRPDIMQTDMTASPPLDYAGLDLLRKAASSKKIQMPEVHMMGGDARHIAMAAPVLKGDQVLAVVLTSFELDVFQKNVKTALANETAWFKLKQGDLVLATSGASSEQKGKILDDILVPGTRWRITINKQQKDMPLSQSELLGYVVVSTVLILLVGLLSDILFYKDKRQKIIGSFKKLLIAGKANAKLLATRKKGMTDDADITVNQQSEESENESAVKLVEQPVNPIFMGKDAIEVTSDEDVPRSIFRAYDIRGIVDETLTEHGVYLIGQAIASEALNEGQRTIVIARDGRLHSPRLSESLAKGIQSTACNVIDIGQVPTPVLYFATHQLDTQSGVMITGSHNPANYNGLKIVIAGNTLSGEAIQRLYQRIEKAEFESGEGSHQEQMMLPEYIGAITSDVRLGRMIKVVVDCGNGVAGEAAPMLLSTLGCEVVPLYCEVDGNFPNHHPDPSKPENLQELIEKVREEGAELGLAFDGDGDRLGVVDSEGNIIWPDRQMMLYAIDVLSRQAGADIIYDVKCTRNLAKVIAKHGGKPIMSKTGHSLIKAKMKETNAELAGEMSGHIFFKERWYGFDDALYTASRLLEIVTAEFRSTAEIFADLPDSISTPELNISLNEGENFSFIEQLQAQAQFKDAKIITIDGLRVEFKDGWGLVRASNTTPSLVLRFEADDEPALERIKQIFREQMLNVNAELDLPF